MRHTLQTYLCFTMASRSACLRSAVFVIYKKGLITAQSHIWYFGEMIIFCYDFTVVCSDGSLFNINCLYLCDKHILIFHQYNISTICTAEPYAVYQILLPIIWET